MSKSDAESEKYDQEIYFSDKLKELEYRLIALERALEAVLSKIEASESPGAPGTDEPGWFGVTE